MASGDWDEGLETGNELIDEQHRELNAFVTELKTNAGESRTQVLAALDEVMAFAFDHFLLEEDLMRQVAYPARAAQRMVEQHQEFKERARLLVLSFRRGEALSLEPLQSFLEGFLADHETGEDKRLADWIRDQKPPSAVDA